jgi:hypothetical protein
LNNDHADSDLGISTLSWIKRGDDGESPTHGEQENSICNGHYACTCCHPLFVFNQFGDLERSELRPSNVHSADG